MFYVTTFNNYGTQYVGSLWSEIGLQAEVYEYIEDAVEVANIFNSATNSDDFTIQEVILEN